MRCCDIQYIQTYFLHKLVLCELVLKSIETCYGRTKFCERMVIRITEKQSLLDTIRCSSSERVTMKEWEGHTFLNALNLRDHFLDVLLHSCKGLHIGHRGDLGCYADLELSSAREPVTTGRD